METSFNSKSAVPERMRGNWRVTSSDRSTWLNFLRERHGFAGHVVRSVPVPEIRNRHRGREGGPPHGDLDWQGLIAGVQGEIAREDVGDEPDTLESVREGMDRRSKVQWIGL